MSDAKCALVALLIVGIAMLMGIGMALLMEATA